MIAQRITFILVLTCAVLVVLLSAHPILANPVRSHTSAKRTGPASQYPKNWPKQMPIHILYRDGSSATVYIKGPEYWHYLPLVRRAKLHTLQEFQRYAQADQGRTH